MGVVSVAVVYQEGMGRSQLLEYSKDMMYLCREYSAEATGLKEKGTAK